MDDVVDVSTPSFCFCVSGCAKGSFVCQKITSATYLLRCATRRRNSSCGGCGRIHVDYGPYEDQDGGVHKFVTTRAPHRLRKCQYFCIQPWRL